MVDFVKKKRKNKKSQKMAGHYFKKVTICQMNELYCIRSFWRCPLNGDSIHVYGSIKALQCSIFEDTGEWICRDRLLKGKPLQNLHF